MKKDPQSSGWPLTRRMLVWSLLMACLWGWFPFVTGGQDGLRDLVNSRTAAPEEPDFDFDPNPPYGPILTNEVMINLFGIWALSGALTGAIAAFYAPATEPTNPIRSNFFGRVGRQTFWVWFLLTLAVSLSVFLLGAAPGWVSAPLFLMGVLTAYIFALWGALDRALGANYPTGI